jgi:hypothetical protein
MEALSLASNYLSYGMHGMREDETISQIKDPMDIEEQIPPHLDGREEAQGSVQP